MKKVETAYDGKNVNEMAHYAKLMGEVNDCRVSKLHRLEAWWNRHPKVPYALGFLAGMLMVGLGLYHMYTFPPLN